MPQNSMAQLPAVRTQRTSADGSPERKQQVPHHNAPSPMTTSPQWQPQQNTAQQQGMAPAPARMQQAHSGTAVTPNVPKRESLEIQEASPGWYVPLTPGRPLSQEEDEEMNLEIGQTVLQISQMLLQPLYAAIVQGSLPLVWGRAGLLSTLISFLDASQAAHAERQQTPPHTSPGPAQVNLSMVGTYAMELSKIEAAGGNVGEGAAVQMEKFTKLVDQISEVAIQFQVQQQDRQRAKQMQCFKDYVGDMLDLDSLPKDECHLEQFFNRVLQAMATCREVLTMLRAAAFRGTNTVITYAAQIQGIARSCGAMMLMQSIQSYIEAYNAGIASSQQLREIDSQVLQLEQIIMLALNSNQTLMHEKEDEGMAGMTPRTPLHEVGSWKGAGMYSTGMGMNRADFGGPGQIPWGHQGYNDAAMR